MGCDDLEFRILEEHDFEAVWKLILEDYITREPGSAILKFNDEQAYDFCGYFARESISHRAGLGAFDKQTKELVGINLCILGRKPKKYFTDDVSKCSKKIQQYTECMTSLLDHRPASEVLGTEDYLLSYVLCTKLSHSNAGVGSELYQRSEDIARKQGCEKIFTFATSHFTHKICAKLGYEVWKEALYADYVDPISGEKILEKIPKPHSRISLVVKTL